MKSIRGKILLRMTLTVLISLLLLAVVSIYLNFSSSNKAVQQSMVAMADIAAQRIEKELEACKNVAIDAGSIARLANASVSVEEKKEIVDQRAATHNFRRGNIIGSDGISIFDGKDYSDRSYYQSAMKGETVVSEPLISKITGELSIMVAAPLWEGGIPNTRVVGVIYFVPIESFLNDIVASINVSANGSAYVISPTGYTIAGDNMEWIGTQNIEEEAKTDKSLSELAAIHGQMRSGRTGFSRYKVNGYSSFIAYTPVPQTDNWSLGVTAPVSDFLSSTYTGIIITIVLMLVSCIMAFVIAKRLAAAIGKPVAQCTERLELLSDGDLKAEVPHFDNSDETGRLSRATEKIVQSIQNMIRDLDGELEAMAGGNFAERAKHGELYVGDFQSLIISLRGIVQKLTKTLGEINQSADQVADGSDQMAGGAQALSQGATEQASSVEELAATVTEISGKVNQTAENAADAKNQVDESMTMLDSCNAQMQEMIRAMEEISDKSGEIGKIIKTIEDIAFQTNILALNAAVEAARAGAAGKGFAVVADEVRNLANKSQEASKNTSGLIEGSIRAVEHGTRIAHETAQSLSKVVEGQAVVVGTVDKIASAAEEEAISIAQVSKGIDQISSVVQTNSATAEESAASSEELSGQAQLLKRLVSQFQLSEASASESDGIECGQAGKEAMGRDGMRKEAGTKAQKEMDIRGLDDAIVRTALNSIRDSKY